MEKWINKIDHIFKSPEQFKKIVFVTPKPINQTPDEIQFEFSNFNQLDDKCLYELKTILIPLLNNYKRLLLEQQQFGITNTTWDYVALLSKIRKIILNNSQIFKYTTTSSQSEDDNKEEDLPHLLSSSLDFELVMILYMIASKEQSLVDDSKTNQEGNKDNAIHLINAKVCLEEAYLIAKDCNDNLQNITYDNNNLHTNLPYDLLSYKKHISDIKTDHISNEDSTNYLIKSNPSSCSGWINDIGGLELMKARSIIAYCQANENFYKAVKYTNKEDYKTKMNISFSISELYKSIISKSGILHNEKFDDNNIKKFSKFMYYYWIFNAHKYAFKMKCNIYCATDITNEDLLAYYDEPDHIPAELIRFGLLDKYYNKITKIIKNNKNLSWYKPIIDKKKDSVNKINTGLIKLLDEYKLNSEIATTDESESSLLNTFEKTYCTILSNKITFKSFIDKSLSRLQNIKNFIDFCDNRYIIDKPINITKGNDGNDGNEINELKGRFKQKLIKWEQNNKHLKNDKSFMLGKMDSDLKWMIFFVSLIDNDPSLLADKISYNVLKTSISQFIEIYDK
jgi:hypothetical protein